MVEIFKLNFQQIVSVGFLLFIFIFLFFVRPDNQWHDLAISEVKFSHKIVVAFSLLLTIFITIIPMSFSPYWNGSMILKADKQQYDRMGDALLQGHLYIDNNDIDPALAAMDNPYNFKERERLGIKYHWDEAYYNHHYYMYFGVVPTIILFIPFKLLTGQALLSYQATQIFASLTIIGLFYLFYILCKHNFPKFPFSLYLLLSSVFSILSIGYSISAPALYCTAIVSAVCLMVWSIICFLKGAWFEESAKNSTKYLLAGALFGALAFGCRPPVALANIIVIAVVYQVLKKKNTSGSDIIKKLMSLLIPFLLIGVLLMLYNYARFDNAFEFGQSYQLTLADQHEYRNFWKNFNLRKLAMGLFLNFYAKDTLTDSFPFIQFNGVFFNFPILLLSVKIFSPKIALYLKNANIYFITSLMLLIPLVITLFDVHWSPFLTERYHLDFYYLLCIASYIAIAAWLAVITEKRRIILLCGITILAFAVIAVEFLFFCIPFDGSYTYWYPEVLTEIYKGLRFGL